MTFKQSYAYNRFRYVSLQRGVIRTSRAETPGGQLIGVLCTLYIKLIKKYHEISTLYECVEKLSMIIGCNI